MVYDAFRSWFRLALHRQSGTIRAGPGLGRRDARGPDLRLPWQLDSARLAERRVAAGGLRPYVCGSAGTGRAGLAAVADISPAAGTRHPCRLERQSYQRANLPGYEASRVSGNRIVDA